MTNIERTIAHYRKIETERELTEDEESQLVGLLRCADADRIARLVASYLYDQATAGTYPVKG